MTNDKSTLQNNETYTRIIIKMEKIKYRPTEHKCYNSTVKNKIKKIIVNSLILG